MNREDIIRMKSNELRHRILRVCREAGADSDFNIVAFNAYCDSLMALGAAAERDELQSLETDAHFIFNNPPSECTQEVRDVIEWYASSIRARGSKAD